ncbi:MAG: hypothetical protein K2X03_25935 [Bryobacteraceae bacterium]|nr:hypothetical protein [Bryobacteraceae bacterium]
MTAEIEKGDYLQWEFDATVLYPLSIDALSSPFQAAPGHIVGAWKPNTDGAGNLYPCPALFALRTNADNDGKAYAYSICACLPSGTAVTTGYFSVKDTSRREKDEEE